MLKKPKTRFCRECGQAYKMGERFCSKCGKKLHSMAIGQRKTRKNWIWIWGSIVVVAFLITAMVSGMSTNKEKSVNRAHNLALIGGIVSEFDCSCGQCEKTLKNCDCPTARETQNYISKAVDKGKYSRKKIIKMVSQRYGHSRRDNDVNGG